MNGCEDRLDKWNGDFLAATLRDTKRLAEERLRRGRSETHDDLRLDELHLFVEPRAACADLAVVRFLVNPTLRFLAALPLEVLHRVGDIHGVAIDSGFLERGVQQAARGAHKGMPFLVFLSARLLADNHHAGARWALAEYGLCAHHPELAPAAHARGLSQRTERRPRRNEIRRASGRNRQLTARRHGQRPSLSCGMRACESTSSSACPRSISRWASTFSLFFSASSCCWRS